MQALILNCTLNSSPEKSNTGALAETVAKALENKGVSVQTVRIADQNILPGVSSESLGEGDDWPEIHQLIVDSEILVIASPTWVGHPSSFAQKVIERLDGMISETKDDGRPLAYDKVAGVVVTGNEDGAHHVISEICGALGDIGFTIPPQAWTYWNKGPGPGPNYLDTDEGHEWSKKTGEAAANNLYAVATALSAYPVQ
jgi:multimeric flavodoxin WrbA